MTLTPNLIVFDCDGTLADSQHLIVQAMRLTFQSAGLAIPERAEILRTVGLSVPEALLMLAPDQYPDARNELARLYREWCMNLRRQPNWEEPMFEGAASLLFSLAAKDNVLLGLATGKSRRGVDRFIEQNGLHGMFVTLQTADSAPSKPHPAMLLQAMEEAGATPRDNRDGRRYVLRHDHGRMRERSGHRGQLGLPRGSRTQAERGKSGGPQRPGFGGALTAAKSRRDTRQSPKLRPACIHPRKH